MKTRIVIFFALVISLPHAKSAQAVSLSQNESEVRMNEVLRATKRVVESEDSTPTFEDRLRELGAVITEDSKANQKLAFVKLPTSEVRPHLVYYCVVYRVDPDAKVKFIRGEMINIDLRKVRDQRNTPK